MKKNACYFVGLFSLTLAWLGCSQNPVTTPPNSASTPAQAAAADPQLTDTPHALATPPDYDDPDSWLCRPGRNDFCDVNLDTTLVSAAGEYTPEPFAGAATNPPVDCFYVYPTVSVDPGGNSDLTPNAEEAGVILNQAARFRSVCRVFAPMYRQVTLTALRARVQGNAMAVDGAAAYGDVKRAWEHYLTHNNNGRGVILIGHSQGSGMLTRLLATEIDGKPSQQLLVSAMLTGSNTAVPVGELVGRAFQHLPLCTEQSEVGCIISYVTFRDDVPPPSNSRFGRVRGAETDPSQQAACTNPAVLDGSNGALHAYLASGDSGFSVETRRTEWVQGKPGPDTPFVTLPGLLTAKCVYDNGFSYLSVTTHSVPTDPRTNSIAGDVYSQGQRLDDWGLHLIDMNVAMGNLINIARQQGQSWQRKHRR